MILNRHFTKLGKKTMLIIEGHEKEYQDWKDKNTDPYGSAIFKYVGNWANNMEAEIAKGAKLEDIAIETSHTADTEGVTGFMYGIAVVILAKYWVHGEQLRIWHNLTTQIQDEGEKANKSGGVLNPALLSIGTGEEM